MCEEQRVTTFGIKESPRARRKKRPVASDTTTNDPTTSSEEALKRRYTKKVVSVAKLRKDFRPDSMHV